MLVFLPWMQCKKAWVFPSEAINSWGCGYISLLTVLAETALLWDRAEHKVWYKICENWTKFSHMKSTTELFCTVAQANQEFDHLLGSSGCFFPSRKLLQRKHISVQISLKKEKMLWYPATARLVPSQGLSHKEVLLGADVAHQGLSAPRGRSTGPARVVHGGSQSQKDLWGIQCTPLTWSSVTYAYR